MSRLEPRQPVSSEHPRMTTAIRVDPTTGADRPYETIVTGSCVLCRSCGSGRTRCRVRRRGRTARHRGRGHADPARSQRRGLRETLRRIGLVEQVFGDARLQDLRGSTARREVTRRHQQRGHGQVTPGRQAARPRPTRRGSEHRPRSVDAALDHQGSCCSDAGPSAGRGRDGRSAESAGRVARRVFWGSRRTCEAGCPHPTGNSLVRDLAGIGGGSS